MKRIVIAALAAALLAGVTPAFAKEDCNAGYKDFIGKMSSHMSSVSGNELAEYVRKSLGAYDFMYGRRQLLAPWRLGSDPGRYGQEVSTSLMIGRALLTPTGAPAQLFEWPRQSLRAPDCAGQCQLRVRFGRPEHVYCTSASRRSADEC